MLTHTHTHIHTYIHTVLGAPPLGKHWDRVGVSGGVGAGTTAINMGSGGLSG